MVTRSSTEIFLEQNLHFVNNASRALKSNPRDVHWLNQTCRCWQKDQTLNEVVGRCLHQYGTALRPVSRLRRFLGRGKCFAEKYSSNMCSMIITQANCQLVVKGENYIPDYTPFTVDTQGKLMKTGVQIRVCGFSKQALGIHFRLTNWTLLCRSSWSKFLKLMKSDRYSGINSPCLWLGRHLHYNLFKIS